MVLLTAYAALTAAVIIGSPLDAMDAAVSRWDLFAHSHDVRYGISLLVLTGQRAPAATAVGAYVAWRAWQTRSWRPVTLYVLALLVLNLSVAAVKYSTGRLGPKETTQAHTVLAGGNIFPSGHASNAVVMFGIVAMLVPPARRRIAWTLASIGAAVVGLGTIVVDTHWVTDVIGAWLAGALVLLALPVLTPPVHRILGPRLDRFGRWLAGYGRRGVRYSRRMAAYRRRLADQGQRLADQGCRLVPPPVRAPETPGAAGTGRPVGRYRSAMAGMTSRPRISSGVIAETRATVPCTSEIPRVPRPRSRSMSSPTFSPRSPGSRGSMIVFSIES